MKTSRFTFWGQEIVLAVGKPKEEFKAANVMLSISELNEGVVYTLEDSSGTGFRRFAIAFNEERGLKGSTIAHEVWHLPAACIRRYRVYSRRATQGSLCMDVRRAVQGNQQQDSEGGLNDSTGIDRQA